MVHTMTFQQVVTATVGGVNVDIPINGATAVCLTMHNLGSEDVTFTGFKSATDASGILPTDYNMSGSVSAGSTFVSDIPHVGCELIRLVLVTGTGTSSVSVQASGVEGPGTKRVAPLSTSLHPVAGTPASVDLPLNASKSWAITGHSSGPNDAILLVEAWPIAPTGMKVVIGNLLVYANNASPAMQEFYDIAYAGVTITATVSTGSATLNVQASGVR